MNTVWEKRRKRLFEIIEIGSNYDAVCWGYDFFNTFTILLNLTVSIMELNMPERIIIAVIQRNHRILVPKGDTVLRTGDVMVIGAESFQDNDHIKLKEITLQQRNPWTNHKIKDLDISRHTIIILVKRDKKMLIPSGNLTLLEGDTVVLYTQTYMANADDLEI